jgi:succinate dehydrogenase/fumarate reductase flavoprotein subunit
VRCILDRRAVTIAAKATIVATGGLTRLYRRNSASANMGGDGYALALRAGAPLDRHGVRAVLSRFGHLAPRLIGMDPIMWDPFRYKLGGRLLNSEGEEFTARYGVSEEGVTSPPATSRPTPSSRKVEAGRGSPHGGAYLSFEHCSEAALRLAFGPVIDRPANNQIDLTKMPIEVAPIAHYHMGGVVADERMATEVAGPVRAGEAVGGANGANRLSGNAITEALVFGRRAGRSAAERASASAQHRSAGRARADARSARRPPATSTINTAAMIERLQATMADDVGPFRTQAKLERALATIATMTARARRAADRRRQAFDCAARLVRSAQHAAGRPHRADVGAARGESRGAHQREDLPGMLPQWRLNQVARLAPAARAHAGAAAPPAAAQ